jgi:NAD(P)-dependent dehydrogenase (short-subunit alcohol dehydrogenase family)
VSELSDITTIVVGASRGLGRGIAAALADAGAPVIAVARRAAALADLAGGHDTIQTETADAGDPSVAGRLLDRYKPRAVVLVAGATPLMRPLHQQTWETFSVNWHTDVRIVFNWLRESLMKPLAPGSRVVVISSGAALAGSPLSGGYAGAKATQLFITGYAQDEATRAGLGITFTAVLPRLTPLTDLGRPAVQAYAARSGRSEDEYLEGLGDPLTPAIAGAAIVELLRSDATSLDRGYLLTGSGLQKLPHAPVTATSSAPPPPHDKRENSRTGGRIRDARARGRKLVRRRAADARDGDGRGH